MRALLVPAAAAALLATAPFALAAGQTATGTVKAFDMKAHTLTLNDGTLYQLPAGFKDPGLKSGEKVQVSWDMQSGKHEASKVTIVK
jgi:Cu/Ag efflux protein CusF